MIADAKSVGGDDYAYLCSLAYRQCAAACGLAADGNKQPLFFTKENSSNGDICTVDVFFPMDPQWVLLSPTLAKATLVPILTYANSWHWKFPNAPHDLGTYPIARGTDDGGEGMPVEESGNMLILCDAIAQAEGTPEFVAPWWDNLTEWAKYLEKYGLDPENQLCTDDFMGHLAHNANLSVKAILGLAAYGDLCKMRGDQANADRYMAMAKADAKHWMEAAGEEDHYRLAFDKPNSWSQKYNLVWDTILGLNVFPPEVAAKEIRFYKKHMLRYGVPLDSRTHLTKTDWSLWSASMATNQADFQYLIAPICDYLNNTTARLPLVDSYITDNVRSDGMRARPVVGGIFIKLLTDRDIWNKWAQGDKWKAANWAPVPKQPITTVVVPTSDEAPILWRFSTEKPAGDWTSSSFDASSWKEAPGGFGSAMHMIHTPWSTSDIWIRREVTLPASFDSKNLRFMLYHDEDSEIYINGVLASTEGGYNNGYEDTEISPEAVKLLTPGAKITLAAHCHQTVGGQGIDIGISSINAQ